MVTLETSSPFRNLSRGELVRLQAIAREQHYAGGMEIFKEGDNGDGIYVVKDGLVEISALVAPRAAARVFITSGRETCSARWR